MVAVWTCPAVGQIPTLLALRCACHQVRCVLTRVSYPALLCPVRRLRSPPVLASCGGRRLTNHALSGLLRHGVVYRVVTGEFCFVSHDLVLGPLIKECVLAYRPDRPMDVAGPRSHVCRGLSTSWSGGNFTWFARCRLPAQGLGPVGAQGPSHCDSQLRPRDAVCAPPAG